MRTRWVCTRNVNGEIDQHSQKQDGEIWGVSRKVHGEIEDNTQKQHSDNVTRVVEQDGQIREPIQVETEGAHILRECK